MKLTGSRELILAGVLIAIGGSAWLFIFHPRSTANATMRKEIRNKSMLLDDLDRTWGEQSQKLQEEITELDSAVKIMRIHLPQDHQHDAILLGLWQRALQNRIWIRKFKFVTELTGKDDLLGNPYSKDIFNITVSGNYLDFYSFLQALENWPRVIRMDTIEIEKNRAITKDFPEQMSPTLHGQVTVRLKLRFFWGDRE